MKLDVSRLKLALLRGRVSTTVFAKRIELDNALVSYYLMGRSTPQEETIKKMAQILEVSVGFLTGEAMISEEGAESDLYETSVNKAYLEVVELLKITKGQHLLLMDKHFDAVINFLKHFENLGEKVTLEGKDSINLDSTALQMIYQLHCLNDVGNKAAISQLALLLEVPRYQDIKMDCSTVTQCKIMAV